MAITVALFNTLLLVVWSSMQNWQRTTLQVLQVKSKGVNDISKVLGPSAEAHFGTCSAEVIEASCILRMEDMHISTAIVKESASICHQARAAHQSCLDRLQQQHGSVMLLAANRSIVVG